MMNALSGSSANVTGSSNATVNAGPMPGRTPTAVPSVTPANAHNRCGMVSAARKPSPRACSVSMPRLDQRRQHAGRQRNLQQARKYEVGANGQEDGGDRIADRMPRVESTRGEP